MRRRKISTFSAAAVVTTLLTAALIAACSGGGESDETDEVPAVEQSESELAIGTPGGDLELRSGCSHVEWCNAPGAIGTQCFHERCSTEDAIAECRRETRSICGRATCPWVLIDFDGEEVPILPCP